MLAYLTQPAVCQCRESGGSCPDSVPGTQAVSRAACGPGTREPGQGRWEYVECYRGHGTIHWLMIHVLTENSLL